MAARIPPVPDWLDELTLEPGPPWLTMGVRALGHERLTPPTDDERTRRAHLLAERRDDVLTLDDRTAAAASEVLELLPTNAAPDPDRHPLEAAALLVAEDLCLMVDREGHYRLDAAVVCFPSYWRLAEKMGRTVAAIHAPVPHYAEDLADRVDTFLARLRPERPVWRRNWDLHDNPELFAPTVPAPVALDVDEVADGVWLRSEHQTLRCLPRSRAILFTIRTQQVPLGVLVHRPDLARRMADALLAYPDDLRRSRLPAGGADAILTWLRSAPRSPG